MARPVPGRAAYPGAVERAYRRLLLRRVETIHGALLERLSKILDKRQEQIDDIERGDAVDRFLAMRADGSTDYARPQARTDALEDIARELLAVVAVFRRNLPKPPAKDIEQIAGRVDEHATQQIVKRIPTVNVMTSEGARGLYDIFLSENVDLITSISTDHFDQIEDIVREGFAKGTQTRTLRKMIEERFNVSRSRAALIARDQVSKLNGQITMDRQQKLGISKYVWSTSGDERVRDTHRANDGKVFAWNDPPATGHPGQDYQCRCVAEPIFDDEDPDEVAGYTRDLAAREKATSAT